jgi:hypothetical protein
MPRKVGSGKGDRHRIQFAYNADREMPIGVVLRYLIDNPQFTSRDGKHMGLDAMAAFWKPFAYQEFTDASEDDLKRIAREAIEALSAQIALISSTFDVEPPPLNAEAQQEQLKGLIQQSVTEAMLTLVESGAIALSPSGQQGKSSRPSEPLEGVDFDEDAIFGNLLENQSTLA